MIKNILIFLSLACSLACVAAQAADEALFVRRIAPLLAEKCLACHSKDEAKIKGGLDLRSRGLVLKGGDSGEAALVPGKPDASPFFPRADAQQR